MKFSRRDVALAIMGSAAVTAVAASPAPATKIVPEFPFSNPKTASSDLREYLVEAIGEKIEEFTEHASMADIYLMHQVLWNHANCSLGKDAEVPELKLPVAFAQEMGLHRTPCFVYVPDELEEEVERHVQRLMVADRARV